MGCVLTENELVEVLQDARNQGQRIVTTNGCFDVLHTGHVRYLQSAKNLGDLLVVLVNSDASVSRLKGPKRPVQNEEDRAEMLAALACVDYVAIFHHDTPVQLLERVRPNIHAKGGDYDAENLPEAPILRGMGAEMVFLPVIEGRSTTSIIQRVLDAYGPTPHATH